MKRKTRYILVLVVAAVLVNLPLVHSTIIDQRVQRSGVDVQATVVEHRTVGGQHLVSFTFPKSVDPDQRTGQADLEPAAYDRAVSTGELQVRVLKDDPSAYVADGQVENHAILVMTLIADALLLVTALLLWKVGGRRRPQLRAIAVEDVERGGDGVALDRIEGQTYLIRGEVSALEPGQVVLELGGRSVLVFLDGHVNPVGYQQVAQVRARLV
ncbi:hypothetical protein ASC77_13950 [Nocardioides sp. Root1257]|uniref:hypothetical protein n=1 Tax=unclassified Nocardioides TaxID=2615069 RepID=UPI0006F73263|nr:MULTISPECIES: hypothetical protein [unclassified Nocardioides]KQW47550.1 hypothetical protein ASC77_13950 [Nocardioides sp. Root1257]KRC45706.1 hypothetical protein ASE24_13955 [Nocardioides sp. Root224]